MADFGNQLFQIASTIGIATKSNHRFCFPEWEYQDFFLHRLPSLINLRYVLQPEFGFTYNDIGTLIQASDLDWDLQGYFQSWKYFEHCKELVKHYFTPKDIVWDLSSYVSIHIRRGDYLEKSDYHTNLGLDYYRVAMQHFPNETFIVFSDDINWCMNNFTDAGVEYWNGSDDANDLFTMSSCKGHVIANSSYSWWASYLSGNKTIAPKNWFQTDINTKDLYLPDWTVI